MNNIFHGMTKLIEFDNIEQDVLLCRNLGIKFTEPNMNLVEFQIDNINLNKLIFSRGVKK